MNQATFITVVFIFILHISSCNSMENSVRPGPVNEKGGYFFTARDGSEIYIWEYNPVPNPSKTFYIISGITGINHKSEEDLIDILLVKYLSMRCMAESKKMMKAMKKNALQADYPLLLLYGDNDNIVDKSGCDEIYAAWKGKNKSYLTIKGGSHGKSTVVAGAENIIKWVEGI